MTLFQKKSSLGNLLPKMHVLLVDDDPLYCRVFESVAKTRGIVVTSCATIDEVDTLALPDVFDVAVIDYYLDGLAHRLKGPTIAQHLHATPVILVSRDNHCVEDNVAWPSEIRLFVSKSSGIPAILDVALGLKPAAAEAA